MITAHTTATRSTQHAIVPCWVAILVVLCLLGPSLFCISHCGPTPMQGHQIDPTQPLSYYVCQLTSQGPVHHPHAIISVFQPGVFLLVVVGLSALALLRYLVPPQAPERDLSLCAPPTPPPRYPVLAP